MTVGRQGHYAGAMSRLVAFMVDAGTLWGLYLLGQLFLNVAAKLVTGDSFNLTNDRWAAFAVLTAWEFLYFAYQWGVSGKTLGMALLGLQVVTREGGPISWRQAIYRTLGLALTLLTLGIGFLGIVFQRERRALNDFIAGTAVVYDWDARSAHLRWLARRPGQPEPVSHHRSLVPEERTDR
jgi:uncharacterized RDD family membrane protein YckC